MRIVRETVTEYGIQTQNSKTILMVTEDLREAERMLDMVGEGRLITRTVVYGLWQPVTVEAALPAETVES